jgi:hypothetical protein
MKVNRRKSTPALVCVRMDLLKCSRQWVQSRIECEPNWLNTTLVDGMDTTVNSSLSGTILMCIQASEL